MSSAGMSLNEARALYNVLSDVDEKLQAIEQRNLRVMVSDVQRLLMVMNQLLAIMRRGNIPEDAKAAIDFFQRFTMTVTMAAGIIGGGLLFGPGGAVAAAGLAGLGTIGLMQGQSQHPTMELLMSNTILDAEMEARMRR